MNSMPATAPSDSVAESESESLPPLLEVEGERAPTASLAANEAAPETKVDEAPAADVDAALEALATGGETEGGAGGELEVMREILVGGALKAVRRDLHLTVRNLRGTVKRVQHEFAQKTEAMEASLEALKAQVEAQRGQVEESRAAFKEQVDQSVEQVGAQLSGRIAEQNEALALAVKQLQADIELKANEQAHALEALDAKILAALETQAEEFRKGKMNRSDFAEALSSLAGQMSGD